VALGAQTVSEHESGAYTGELSGAMLKDVGCQYVLVGHSERRQHFGEHDAVVAAKFHQAKATGLIPILCVGETDAEREAGQTETVIARQLQAVLDAASGADLFQNAVVAYEPIWAIGTGKTATPEVAQSVHAFIRQYLENQQQNGLNALPLLYGGSVKVDNAAHLFAKPDIDGALVGGASLTADSFLGIAACIN
jgi:triosephosphate isomerase